MRALLIACCMIFVVLFVACPSSTDQPEQAELIEQPAPPSVLDVTCANCGHAPKWHVQSEDGAVCLKLRPSPVVYSYVSLTECYCTHYVGVLTNHE
jgi:hypothetical protein